MKARLGAYILPGDPVWLRSSLTAYYHLLDDLVIVVPDGGVGWTGQPLPVDECLAAIRDVDVAGLAREVHGSWRNDAQPMSADTAQRQSGIDALSASVDWILQIDNDEVLPDPDALVAMLQDVAGEQGVEWPMRVLFRHLRGPRYLEVAGRGGEAVYEYPGSIAVRSHTRLTDARRHEGPVIRVVVQGDETSLQVTRPPGVAERRHVGLRPSAAIVHNSWAKSPSQVWRKTRSWGHAQGLRTTTYYVFRWFPAPLIWRAMRDFHPFARGLWPRLRVVSLPKDLLVSGD